MQCGPAHKGKQPRHAPPVPAEAAAVPKVPPPRRKRKAAAAPDTTPEASAQPSTPAKAPAPAVQRKALERQLAEAIRTENYEEAARLRDALQQENPGA